MNKTNSQRELVSLPRDEQDALEKYLQHRWTNLPDEAKKALGFTSDSIRFIALLWENQYFRDRIATLCVHGELAK